MKKICLYCKNEFELKYPNQKFCSQECQKIFYLQIRRERYAKPLEKIEYCLHCGKKMDSYGSKKFCSKECIRLHRNDSRRKTDRRCDRLIEPKVLNKCLYCGSDIKWTKPIASIYHKKKFCSRDCCAKYFKIHREIFFGRQFKIDGFKIAIKKISNKYIWEAIKNNKIILKSDNYFKTFNECEEDARIAFEE